MRIEFDGVTVLSRKYESFDELTDDFIDYETQRGSRVPDYDLGIMLGRNVRITKRHAYGTKQKIDGTPNRSPRMTSL